MSLPIADKYRCHVRNASISMPISCNAKYSKPATRIVFPPALEATSCHRTSGVPKMSSPNADETMEIRR